MTYDVFPSVYNSILNRKSSKVRLLLHFSNWQEIQTVHLLHQLHWVLLCLKSDSIQKKRIHKHHLYIQTLHMTYIYIQLHTYSFTMYKRNSKLYDIKVLSRHSYHEFPTLILRGTWVDPLVLEWYHTHLAAGEDVPSARRTKQLWARYQVGYKVGLLTLDYYFCAVPKQNNSACDVYLLPAKRSWVKKLDEVMVSGGELWIDR